MNAPQDPALGIAERVLDVVALILRVNREDISMASSIKRDLKADSMDIVALAIALEDEFSGSIDESVASQFDTIGDIVRYIEEHCATRPG